MAIAGNQDPCFSSQTQLREETAKQPQEPTTWGDIMNVQTPDLPPFFCDALAGVTAEDDDDEEEFAPHLLEDDEEKDAVLPPNTFCPPSSQSRELPSSPAVDLDLLELC
ncbi:hypothetical protein ROHU_006281 [Labeo rohita]|uniref:Uncharacterized protein n=1 Tax=Labeo rohita TaxID=84645 RepID=A0A498MU25_LABRO|nr:hypothetical protein ROHU_006281 [Labeo rohita]